MRPAFDPRRGLNFFYIENQRYLAMVEPVELEHTNELKRAALTFRSLLGGSAVQPPNLLVPIAKVRAFFLLFFSFFFFCARVTSSLLLFTSRSREIICNSQCTTEYKPAKRQIQKKNEKKKMKEKNRSEPAPKVFPPQTFDLERQGAEASDAHLDHYTAVVPQICAKMLISNNRLPRSCLPEKPTKNTMFRHV